MDWQQIVLEPFVDMAKAVVGYLPYLVAGAVILIVGHFVAKAARGIVKQASLTFRLEKISELIGVGKLFGRGDIRYSFASLLGTLAYIFVFLVFVTMAASTMKLEALAQDLRNLISYTPNFLLALVVLFISLILAQFVSNVVRYELGKREVPWYGVIAGALQIFLVVLGIGVALEELHIATPLLVVSLLILLGGLALGFGLAFGIAVGLGAKPWIDQWLQRKFPPPGEPSTETPETEEE